MAPAPNLFHGAAYVDARHSTFTGAGRDNITNVNSASEVKELLSTLKPVDSGGYYVQPCMEETRENLLVEIDEWLEDFCAPNILWITGSPGSGKSTIASSLVPRLMKRRRLGSYFAFKPPLLCASCFRSFLTLDSKVPQPNHLECVPLQIILSWHVAFILPSHGRPLSAGKSQLQNPTS